MKKMTRDKRHSQKAVHGKQQQKKEKDQQKTKRNRVQDFGSKATA